MLEEEEEKNEWRRMKRGTQEKTPNTIFAYSVTFAKAVDDPPSHPTKP